MIKAPTLMNSCSDRPSSSISTFQTLTHHSVNGAKSLAAMFRISTRGEATFSEPSVSRRPLSRDQPH
jgi:hypothetical protein